MTITTVRSQAENELLFSTIKLSSKLLGVEIDSINEDVFLNENDIVYWDFDDIYSFIGYNDLVSEDTMQQLGINGICDLIEFYIEFKKTC